MAERLWILIVDDQQRARKSLEALLSTWSHAVAICEASNGREAIQLVKEFRPDLVLMDVRMPEIDGLEATAQIKAQWPQVRVIVLSMYVEHHREALDAGADAFVAKGDAPGTLLDVVSAVMGRGA